MCKSVAAYLLAAVITSAPTAPATAQGGSPPTAPIAATAQEYESRAQAAIDANDFASALVDVENAIKLEPNVDAHYNHLLDLSRKSHEFQPAIDFLHRSMAGTWGKPTTQAFDCAYLVEVYWADYLRESQYLRNATVHDNNAYLISKSNRTSPQYRTVAQGFMLNRLSSDYASIGNYRQALTYVSDAFKLAQATKDDRLTGLTLGTKATIYLDAGAYDKAKDCATRAAKADAAGGDLTSESYMLTLVANVLNEEGRVSDELAYRIEAFNVAQKTNIPALDAAAANLAAAYANNLNFEQAIPLYNEIIKETEQDRSWKACADALSKLADVYTSLGREDEALPLLRKGVEYADQDDGSRQTCIIDQLHLATVLDDTNQFDEAQTVLADALEGAKAIHHERLQAAVLFRQACVDAHHHEYDQAIKALRMSMALHSPSHPEQIIDATELGDCYNATNDPKSAAEWYGKAIDISRRYGLPTYDIASSISLSTLLMRQHQLDKALRTLTEPMLQYPNLSPDTVAPLLGLMMRIETLRGHLPLASMYGKLAVDAMQAKRQSLHVFDLKTQEIALAQDSSTYRWLAAILIRQNRLAEALRVYDLMKRKEFEEYTTSKDASAETIPLTPEEKRIFGQRQSIIDDIADKERIARDLRARQHAASLGIDTFDNHNCQALSQAEKSVQVVRATFTHFIKSLEGRLLKSHVNATSPEAEQALSKRVASFGPGTVVLYALAADDRYYVVALSADRHGWMSTAVSSNALDKKVQTFRDALQDPTIDVTKPAKELYDVIVKPIEPFLAQAHATRLIWSLDGALRYCPISALYDGKQYLIERYACQEFTVEKSASTGDTADTEALGLGVTKPHPGFEALPNVAVELGSLIHDTDDPKSVGILDGVTMLDDKFTRASMVDALESGKYRTVHIASHFEFQPGDDTKSFLLLGDGDKFSLADMKAMPGLFKNVDMLTLSACDTAVGSTMSDGREIDGCAIIAQRDGANTVVASLWPIADASTSELMRVFYQLHRDHPEMSKSEALREAQLALLHGTAMSMANVTPIPHRRGGAGDTDDDEVENLPDFQDDPSKPFAHPYYWAPFVLISKWQ